MNHLKKIGIFFGLLLIGVFVVWEVTKKIRDDQVVKSNRVSTPTPLAYIPLKDNAYKKIPDFLFLNQDSLYISSDDFKEKVFVAEFFFTTCPTICPIMNQNMKKIEDQYGHRSDFGIASFTIDPRHDTPSILKAYSQDYGVWSSNWHFLTGSKDSIYSLANRGFNIYASVNPAVAGGFEHQGYFALIDRQGYIRSRIDPINGNPIVYYSGINNLQVDQLIEDIELLLNE
ncbi:MAG: SCO family protein [Flavobacteriaceae bacterium]|nr:SCO family protein [Flavobacteriaceae bacterium]MCY4215851.1 SCO family protein [Flavobacteriaceae bacterium]MCY4254051.1 SCO family protein [Flavobacteriaceae bacterium]